MAGKRRVYGAPFKAKVALAAAKGDRTTAQLASQFGIHTSQVTAWKKQLMAQVAELCADGRLACLGNPDPADMKGYCPEGKETFDDDEMRDEAPSRGDRCEAP